MIYEHFRGTGAHEAVLVLADLFLVSLHKATTFRILMQDGIKLSCLQVKLPMDNSSV